MTRLKTDLIVAGTPFLAVGPDQARMVRAAGVYALARRGPDGRRMLLFVDWAEQQGPAARASAPWRTAVALGMNEFLFTLGVREPGALQALKTQVIAVADPPLNRSLESRPKAA